MVSTEIPQEIWWMVCQVLQKKQDFKSLFNAALVCKAWASHALPLLYSIHDSSSSDDVGATILGKFKWAGMWRSIILSSIGVTEYPYCLWLRSLGLGDLEQLLPDVVTNPRLRTKFFDGPMKEFEILTRAGKPILEYQQIIEKVGDTVTKFAKDAADQENKTVQLASLEGANLPTSLLAVWTSRLSTLTTLTIRDGSVLTEEVAISIRNHCPTFKDLTCYHIRGATVEENMSAFFRALKKDSLENFAVLSSNEIGYDTIDGLMEHSESLRKLTLSSIQTTSLPFLHLLTKCPYLEMLQIESSMPSQPSAWAADDRDPFLEVSTWLKECKHLRRLDIKNLGGASKLLADVLKSPILRLKELEVKLVDDEDAFYTALGNQADLESLMLRSTLEADLSNKRHDMFMDSICSCGNMKDLDILLVEHLQLTPEDLGQIKESLPSLESLSFDGEDLVTDAFLTPLMGMKSLTTININGLSVCTFEGIKSFLEATAASGSRHGFRLYIMNQNHVEAEITPAQENALSETAAKMPGGTFEFSNWRDPSEDDMSDLSD